VSHDHPTVECLEHAAQELREAGRVDQVATVETVDVPSPDVAVWADEARPLARDAVTDAGHEGGLDNPMVVAGMQARRFEVACDPCDLWRRLLW
jgi:hypothetical protein